MKFDLPLSECLPEEKPAEQNPQQKAAQAPAEDAGDTLEFTRYAVQSARHDFAVSLLEYLRDGKALDVAAVRQLADGAGAGALQRLEKFYGRRTKK